MVRDLDMVSGIWYSSVTDSRLEALTQYVKSIILDDKVMLLSLNGDASFRRYFRVLNKNLIAVDAPPETQKNREFVAIDTVLSKAGITVPKLVAYDFDKGFMLISDLGDKTFANASAQGDKLYYYQKAISLLPTIAAIDLELPLFDKKFIEFELSLFDTWMLDKALNVKLSDDEQKSLIESYDFLVQNCLSQEQCAMHRDYHSRNLMVCGEGKSEQLAIIDFQDMVKGPVLYDLASLLFDCYVVLDKELLTKLKQYAYDTFKEKGYLKNKSYDEFCYELTLTSLQRHVKVLGIFCRLSIRDGKNAYLKDLPRVINYVLEECKVDKRLEKLQNIIEKYVVGKF